MNYRIVIAMLLLFLTGKVVGQPYYFRQYQVENGLSNNTVICSMQDDKGFMWFGTNEGVHRFDGYSFKVFRNEVNHGSLKGYYTNCIYQDKKGTIWLGSDNGLYKFDALTESFNLLKKAPLANIKSIRVDAKGNVWFIADFSVVKYEPQTGRFRLFNELKDIATSICISKNNSIWISTVSGLIKLYKPDTDSFVTHDLFAESNVSRSKWIEKIYADDNMVLAGTIGYGVKLFDIKTGTYKDILTRNADGSGIYVRDILRTSTDEFWIASETGIFIYNLKNAGVVNLKRDFNAYSLSDNAVRSLCRDNEGGIWVGTNSGGINYYQKQLGTFKKYFPQPGANSISGNVISDICPDRYGNLWIGTEDAGLNKLDTKTGVFTHFNASAPRDNISYHHIHSLFMNNDELWVSSTFNQSLDILNIKTGKVVRRYSDSDPAKVDYVSGVIRTAAGKIIAATLGGVYEFDEHTQKFTAKKEFPRTNFYVNLFEDKKGVLWAGTFDDGLKYFDPVTKQFGSLILDTGALKKSHSNRVNWIFEDSVQNLWVATEDGLCRVDPNRKKVKRYTIKNGFPSNTFFAVLEDNRQNLWISTSKGLVCFTPSTQKIKTYTKANGLLSDQFNYNSAYKNPNGTMYFGTVKGLISFNPADIKDSRFIPPIYITGFQVNNKELAINKDDSRLEKSIIYTSAITLPYNKSSFSIDFAALSYVVPELTEYAYKMKGLNQDWTYLQTNRKVYFTGLAPGTYTFYVKASNNYGAWSEKPATLTITILPPVWASVWAYILYLLIVSALIFYLIRRYHRRVEEKHQLAKEREIYNAKIEFFTNVAHEIRTPLTLIKGPMDMIMEQVNDVPSVKDNLQIMEKNTDLLLDLTNQLLDFRKIESKDFSLYFVKADVAEIISNNYLRYKSLANQKKLAFNKIIPQQPFYAYADIDALNKIVSNMLDNAIKYANRKVEIELFIDAKNEFTVKVKNDGSLIPDDLRDKIFEPFYRLHQTSGEPGSGIGLPFARSLAELHSGTLELREPEHHMNVFALVLPVNQNAEGACEHLTEDEATDDIEDVQQDKPVIVVVDDNAEILNFISVNLSKAYHIIAASNGAEALDILHAESVALIISDIAMPVMDGYELCSTVKSTIEYSHVPVILLTAKNNLKSKIEGLELGADAYIEKPFSIRYLEVQIDNLLSNRNKIREHFASSPLAHIKTLAHSKTEEDFLDKLNTVIYENMANINLDVDHLADFMNMSRRTLYRKIKAISNLSPNELINIARLKKAAQLFIETGDKAQVISGMVGFSSEEKLRRNFIRQFGISPFEYVRKNHQKTESH